MVIYTCKHEGACPCALRIERKRRYEIQPHRPVGYGLWFVGFCTGM